MYDYRARSLLGHPVRLTSAHTVAHRSQVMAPHLREMLGLGKGEEWLMPKMVHHHRLHIPGWLSKKTNLTVFAPPPPHFVKTCTKLGLALDFKSLAEKDTIRLWDQDKQKARVKKNALTAPEFVSTDSGTP